MSGRGAVAELLERQGYGVVGTDIWVGRQPSDTPYPNIVVGLYGGAVIDTFSAAEQQPTFQIMLTGRIDEDEENEAVANAVWEDLSRAGSFTADGTAVNCIRMLSVPLDLGDDGSGRPMRSINIEVTYD